MSPLVGRPALSSETYAPHAVPLEVWYVVSAVVVPAA